MVSELKTAASVYIKKHVTMASTYVDSHYLNSLHGETQVDYSTRNCLEPPVTNITKMLHYLRLTRVIFIYILNIPYIYA
jgi:hypothetical protein